MPIPTPNKSIPITYIFYVKTHGVSLGLKISDVNTKHALLLTMEGTVISTAFLQCRWFDIAPSQLDLSLQRHSAAKVFAGKIKIMIC